MPVLEACVPFFMPLTSTAVVLGLADSERQLRNWRSHEAVITCRSRLSTSRWIDGNATAG